VVKRRHGLDRCRYKRIAGNPINIGRVLKRQSEE
jgi:hypothetical protein